MQIVQTQQRAERDAAIARLEQSRIVLALRLVDHHGKKYKVFEEAKFSQRYGHSLVSFTDSKDAKDRLVMIGGFTPQPTNEMLYCSR